MKYADLEWLPVFTIAELWARDEGVLPKDQLWVLLWKAIWDGDFEEGEKSFWGFCPYNKEEYGEIAYGTITPSVEDRLITENLTPLNRYYTVFFLRLLSDNFYELLPILEKLFPRKIGESFQKSIEMLDGLQERYKNMAKYMSMVRVCPIFEDRYYKEKDRLKPHVLAHIWDMAIGSVGIELGAFITWTQAKGYQMPSFLSEKKLVTKSYMKPVSPEEITVAYLGLQEIAQPLKGRSAQPKLRDLFPREKVETIREAIKAGNKKIGRTKGKK